MRRHRAAGLVIAAGVIAGLGLPVATAAPPGEPVGIEVVSSRADAVSGGDARIRVQVPGDVDTGELQLTLNGTDVTADLSASDSGLEGVIEGLRPQGASVLRASGPGVRPATLRVVNHPSSGPIFSGEHQEPFYCQTEDFTTVTGQSLGPALDEHCTVEPRTDYVYRSTEDGSFEPLTEPELSDPDLRPDDLEVIEYDDGTQVPFIVRVRTEVINRGVAETSMLHDPAAPDQQAWNEKLIYRFGGGCTGGWYSQGTGTGGVLVPAKLAEGYALASNSLNVFGNNCNDLLAAESFSMTREAFIEDYGEPIYTMGWGSSGGAYQSHQIADNYPGMLDGIIVGASFPDVGFGMSGKLFDARLLQNYREEHPGALTEDQWLAVSGFGEPAALSAMSNSANRLDPDGSFPAAVPEEVRFDAETNPGGARSTVWDHTINVYGQDPDTGYALRPFDNTGVQYGLQALQEGVLSVAEFLDLNEGVGGTDINLQPTDERISGDTPAIENAYATGRMLSGGGGLTDIPIIDHRNYTDASAGDSHMRYHGFSTRERLVEAAGNADNHVMLTEPNGSAFSPDRPVLADAIEEMDAWILAAQQEGGGHEAVVATRPDTLVDACWTPEGEKIAEEQTYDGPGLCNELYPAHASPRIVAGGPVASNIIQCTLRPVDRTEYGVELSDEQLQRLEQIFSDGVCDWDQPGQGQQPLAGPWAFFETDGEYRIGGEAPGSRPGG